jgi:Flp pilus assembly protein CpaB
MRLTGYEGWHEEVAVWIVACGLIAGAALLGPVPVATTDAPVSTTSAGSQAEPRTEVSVLAVSLTVGGALAMTGSGVALVLTRRRTVSRRPS